MPVKTRPDDSIRSLKAGLESRREELRQMVIARVHSIDTRGQAHDPEYLEGLREAIEAAIDYSIEAATEGDDERSPVPAPLLGQARLAARHQVPLETVLRRYLAGHAVIGDFLAEQAARQAISPEVLRGVLRDQAARTDRVVAVIGATYVAELSAVRPVSLDRRRADQVRRMLDGELVDPSGVDYDFGAWHIGFVLRGGDGDLIRSIAKRLDARRLVVSGDEGVVWAWLGFRNRPHSQLPVVVSAAPESFHMGVGEPAEGPSGWRLTHEQAKAALGVAMRRPAQIAHYKDVALLATAVQDQLLSASLTRLFLDPLDDAKEGGRELRATLRAYFRADQSVTATAAALGVSRNTVANRLRAVEEKIGYLDASCAAHLWTALAWEELSVDHEQIAQAQG